MTTGYHYYAVIQATLTVKLLKHFYKVVSLLKVFQSHYMFRLI
jgi:hypothetical protein